ncbi:MAG: DNA adenine methylase [Bacilli bacterium]|jgi:DNA adenine methylase|nr:DNA adenine methylase [Bacilli bacterium]
MTYIKSFIKWAGGKEKELPIILSNLPDNFERYIEPFVGGGSVYLNINCEKSIINDKSDELILLYNMIKNCNQKFVKKLKEINKNWILLENIVDNNSKELLTLYKNYSKQVNKEKINKRIKINYSDKIYEFVLEHSEEFNGLLSEHFNIKIENFLSEIKKNLLSKIERMRKIELNRGKMSDENILENLECAFKSAYYMHFRYLYNNKLELEIEDEFYCAIFYFIREYCYASMFRYNANGKFNVPYGGISYNRKDFDRKINYLNSSKLKGYMKNTDVYNLDFEYFCKKIKLTCKDFIFLDPPYDTEFSTYAKNEFGKDDQIRLANFLKNTKAKFMLIIKNTEFIYNLYNVKGLYIKSFDKKYLVSIKNRNDKNVEHLIITNYEI